MKQSFLPTNGFKAALCSLATLAGLAASHALDVKVTVENLAPVNGTFITPVWLGFHDGTFDLYDLGAAASPALERLAEDGDVGPLSAAFTASGAGSAQGVLFGPVIPPLAPGESASTMFSLNANDLEARYFSYASMIIPSNDAFIANGDPLVFEIFDAGGNFLAKDFIVLGSMVRDAGTEVNDEIPANTAFFGQAAANTGVDENGVVATHAGFLPAGSGGILDALQFSSADFKASGYPVARVTITSVPDAASASSMLLLSGLGLAIVGKKTRRSAI